MRILFLFLAMFTTGSFAQSSAQSPPISFSVATIRPSSRNSWSDFFTTNGYVARGANLRVIIQDAYGIYDESRYSGLPGWVDSEHFDIEAKVDEVDLARFRSMTDEQRRPLLQALLADRFKLVAHLEPKEFPVYSLVVAKGGPKFLDPKPEGLTLDDNGKPRTNLFTRSNPGILGVQNISMVSLASYLSYNGDIARHVIDKTGLKGQYTFELHWTPENTPATSSVAGGPSIFTAIQEQLGLKLEPAKAPLDTIVVEHIERPTAN